MKIKFKIGEFSKLCQVTVKTLRHYEEVGILVPQEVDQWTGYRYYSVDQLKEMTEIIQLKRLGFSLEEIRFMKEDGLSTPTEEMIQEKILRCDEELSLLQRRRCELTALSIRHKSEIKMENLSIRPLPEIIVASYRATIKSYQDLFNLIPTTIYDEMTRLGCTCPEPGYCYTITHDKEYKGTDIDIEYCEQVDKALTDSEVLKFKTVPAVEKALIYKHYGSYDDFPSTWAKLYAYMEEQGLEISGDPRFNYIDGIWNKESVDEWLTEIQVPIK